MTAMHDRVAQSTPRKTPTIGAARIGIGGPVGSGKTALIERLIPDPNRTRSRSRCRDQ